MPQAREERGDEAAALLEETSLVANRLGKRRLLVPGLLLALAALVGLMGRTGQAAPRKVQASAGTEVVDLFNVKGEASTAPAEPAPAVAAPPAAEPPAAEEKPSPEAEKCSWMKTNCSDTKCCKEAGLQCYQQTPSYAQCLHKCKEGPDPLHWDGVAWSCKELGPRAPGDAATCTENGADCSTSRCCATPGSQCYQKQLGWATCKPSCVEGVDLTDSNADPWTCETLGDRAELAAPWVAEQCSASGDDCRKTNCCAVENEQCYQRDKFWAQCMPQCPNQEQPWDSKTWDCKEIGQRTPQAPTQAEAQAYPLADWVSSFCAKGEESCTKSQCCSQPGMQCFAKNGTYAKCKASCQVGPDLFDEDEKPWTCTPHGPRTPGQAPSELEKPVSPWVAEKCTKNDGSGCLKTGCCADVGHICYTKTDGWATCLNDCVAGQNRSAFGDIDAKPWACKEMGPRTPRPWGKPSLYCISVLRTIGYEPPMMKAQLAKGVGIFACDDYDVYSNEPYQGRGTTFWHPKDEVQDNKPLVPMFLGVGPLGRLDTIPFKPTYVGQSMDSTAGNTELFLRVWHKVRERGHWQNADWTLKVDPDAVLVPDRMRKILEPYNGQSTYIVNCDKPGMAPMMFGSVEMFSKGAMQEFMSREHDCLGALDWKVWGEDYFMGKCLDMLGVSRTNQFSAVADGVCKGVDCGNPDAGAFHPMKDVDSWFACLGTAGGL